MGTSVGSGAITVGAAIVIAGVFEFLGAFLAGLVVAGSEFRHQAMSEVIPAREVLASLFFVSVGMLLNVADIGAHLLATVGLLCAILVGKFAIILGTALLLRLPLRVGILSAATLCQIGEFSFVLLNAASGTDLLPAALAHNLLMAIVLSMLLTPPAIAFGPRLIGGAAYVPWLNRLLGAEPPGIDMPEPPSGHVIVAGYGSAVSCGGSSWWPISMRRCACARPTPPATGPSLETLRNRRCWRSWAAGRPAWWS